MDLGPLPAASRWGISWAWSRTSIQRWFTRQRFFSGLWWVYSDYSRDYNDDDDDYDSTMILSGLWWLWWVEHVSRETQMFHRFKEFLVDLGCTITMLYSSALLSDVPNCRIGVSINSVVICRLGWGSCLELHVQLLWEAHLHLRPWQKRAVFESFMNWLLEGGCTAKIPYIL